MSQFDFNIYGKMEQKIYAPIHPDTDTGDWVLVEKIHGANVSFSYDGTNWRLGKRSGFITQKEQKSFYGIDEAFRPYISNLQLVADTVCYEAGKDLRTGDHTVYVYGELYGKIPDSGKSIQKGVNYTDTGAVAFFDIMVDGEYIPYEDTVRICTIHQIPLAPEICRGTLDELLTYDVEEQFSMVPRVLHNRPVDNAPCEGVILRSLDDNRRFKWKKAQYMERPPKRGPLDTNTLETCISYMNDLRLASYVSKVGPDVILDRSYFSTNMKALVDDVHEDIKEDHYSVYDDSRSMAYLNKELKTRAAQLLNDYIAENTL